jgi:phosphatidylglycerol:prolipoprotein diacylglycerol transferase
MHPELFHVGNFTFHTYGLAFSISILVVTLIAMRRAHVEGMDKEHFLTGVLFCFFGILIMSKGMHIITNFSWYLDSPQRFLNFRSGHVFYGGFIGAVLFPYGYFRFIKEPYLPRIDIAATYMGLGLAIHRAIGCMSAGCCYGKPTDLPWGVTFPVAAPASQYYGVVAVHPTQFYEAILALMMFGLLLFWRKYYKKVPGELITLQIFLYAIGRFMIEFVRGDLKRGYYGPLSTSQWVSVAMVAGCVIMAVYLLRQRKTAELRTERLTKKNRNKA